jgi:hypothetical protein
MEEVSTTTYASPSLKKKRWGSGLRWMLIAVQATIQKAA